jgi:hypothetical protein
MVWVLNDAPIADQAATLVLLGLANHADKYGKDAFPTRQTLAHYARCSVRTVAIKLQVLEAAGVIVRGDQDLVSHRPANRRPVVWNLNHDVKIDQPVGSGYEENLDVQNLHPSADGQTPAPQEEVGVQTTTARGADDGSSGVQMIAHKTSLEPSLNHPIKESSVLNSPALDALHLPDWCPRAERWLTETKALCESRGLDFETALWNYTNSGYFGGEAPNPQRFITNWILVEVDCRRKGKPLPGTETITVDTPESLEQAFELFWEAYPKRERRVLARKAFEWALTQTTEPVDVVTLIKQSKGYKRYCEANKIEDQYIKSPHNWLAESRWTDVYPSGFKGINHTGDV